MRPHCHSVAFMNGRLHTITMLKQIDSEDNAKQGAATSAAAAAPAITADQPEQARAAVGTETPNLPDLIRRLASRTAWERDAAVEDLRRLDVPSLLVVMDAERRERRKRLRILAVLGAVNLILLPLLGFVLHNPAAILFAMLYCVILAGVIAFTQAQKSGALMLAQTDDLHAVGELASALEIRDESVQRAVQPALTRMLPRLRSSDANLLSPRERRVLCRFMAGAAPGRRFGQGSDSEETTLFLLSVLKALEQVGDKTFLPIVRQWAEGRFRGSDPRIRQAAQDCLRYLEQVAGNAAVSQEMLRASSKNLAEDARDLVRPASGANEPAVQNLLRPADPDGSERPAPYIP